MFIDTEGGTKRLNVARLPQPTSWAMLLDEVAEVRKGNVPCSTLVIDTADWAERLCIQAVCARAKVNGIEDFGYGKGYTYVKEEFSKLLDALEEVLNAGHNVVVLAHAAITKFEQPDAVVLQVLQIARVQTFVTCTDLSDLAGAKQGAARPSSTRFLSFPQYHRIHHRHRKAHWGRGLFS